MPVIGNRFPGNDVSDSTWGNRAQIGGTVKELADLEGNRDGIWDNETKPAGTTAPAWSRNSVQKLLGSVASTGISVRDDVRRLSAFLKGAEARWGQPIMDPAVQARLDGGDLFAVNKAIALVRMGRDPSTVTDRFVRAAGSVNGEAIEARDIFTQHFAPTGKPTGHVVVVAPGYLETGRNFYEQIQAWNAAGHDVVVMDQQWAGQSDGTPGGVDRGFGIARDVAAVTAHAAELMRERYGERAGKIALMGNSMGAGAGAVGAYFLNLNDRIALEGPAMPKDVEVVGQAMYFAPTESILNATLRAGSSIPLLNRVQIPMVEGLPRLTNDPRAEHLVTQGGVIEKVASQLSTFARVEADIAVIKDLIAHGAPPRNTITLVHSERDALANYGEATWLRDTVGGDRVAIVTVAGSDHVLEQNKTNQHYAVDAVNAALAR